MKGITDNKTLCKAVKPLFSDKQIQSGKIILVKGDEINDGDKEVANTFNNFFANVIKNLILKMDDDHLLDTEILTGRSKNHPSIVAASRLVIKKGTKKFSFN